MGEQAAEHPLWKTLLAFAIIYLVWGSTFLAIRVAVREMPPFLCAAARFLLAGAVLYGWAMAKREELPNGRQWLSILLIAFLIFFGDYGLVFWAEQHVASGVTAVMLATIPAFMALAEIVLLRTQKLTMRLALALSIGIVGVAVLMSRSLPFGVHLGTAVIDRKGAGALILASMCWAIASALIRKLPMPKSKVMSSSTQMVAGGAMLAVASVALGELRAFHPTAVTRAGRIALADLIVFGSIIGFTAFVWLIGHQSPTRVGTYAYVNPVVAVLLGYLLGGEALGLRTVLGALLVLVSVVVITTDRRRQAATVRSALEEEPVAAAARSR